MTQAFDEILDALVASLDFADDVAEEVYRSNLRAGGKAMIAAIAVDAARKEGDDVSEQLSGLIGIASSFQDADLPTSASDSLKANIAKVVKVPGNPELEDALHGSFDAVLDGLVSGRGLSEFMDNYNPPDDEDPA
jgi:hypothetical protein